MLDMNKMINEETERIMNSKQNRLVHNEATKLANEEIGKRKNTKPRTTQLKQKDPVVAWLESQPEIKKVHLDDSDLIISADYNDTSVIHDIEVIEYKSNDALDEFMKS